MLDKDKVIRIPAIEIEQPIGTFFVGVMEAQDLVEVSVADIRTMTNELDSYMGIQRRLSPPRIKELKSYVTTYDATFPSSVILAIKEENANWDAENSILEIFPSENIEYEKIAKILDGQHRVEGLKGLQGKKFQMSVSIFVGTDVATEANIFATVNLAQTKVNRSLVYDLFDYEKFRSPQKTAHHVTVALDQQEDGPFYHRIKRLGSATAGRYQETLTQAAVVEAVIDFISNDPMKDRDSFLRKYGLEKPSREELEKFPFRGLFFREHDEEIALIIARYFGAVRDKWPSSWDDTSRQGNVLPKTNGFKALMRFLKPTYLALCGDDIGKTIEKSEFTRVLEKVSLRDKDFNIETFPPGTSGESRLYKMLYNDVFENDQNRMSLF